MFVAEQERKNTVLRIGKGHFLKIRRDTYFGG